MDYRKLLQLAKENISGAHLDSLLLKLFEQLPDHLSLDTQPRGAVLLLNSRHKLIQVAQQGLSQEEQTLPLNGILDALQHPARPCMLSLPCSTHAPDEQYCLLLPLTEQERILGGIVFVLTRPAPPSLDDHEFLSELAHVSSGIISRCLISEKLQVREVQLEEARTDAIRRLGAASEYRDNETGLHIVRMAQFARVIAKEMGLSEDTRETLLIAAPMHDVGKIGIADAVLLKPGRLTPDEFEIMKAHTEIGASLLNGDDALLVAAREIALSHHENWDGSGYPQGLTGEHIPITGRICAVADVFDALTSSRPYKEAWPIPKAVAWIYSESGKKFDPNVVAAFQRALPHILRIHHLYRDEILDPNQIIDLPTVSRSDRVPFITWSEALSVGIDIIDMHHRYLLDIINDFYYVILDKQGARQISRVLKALHEYSKVHFRAEEEMMKKYGHTQIKQQENSHRYFEEKIREFQDDVHNNPLTAPLEMLHYLRDWWLSHIQHEDIQLRELVSQ